MFDRVRSSLSEDTKRQMISAGRRLREPTARLRMLPSVITIGAMRGGTTSLYNYLCMHPQVQRPLHKEIEYFTTNYSFGESWYRAHFSLPWRGGSFVTTESSPSYLFDGRAPARARKLLPAGKFIVLLRNPADRAFSHYQLMVTKGFETLSFADALAAEAGRVASEREKMGDDPELMSLAVRRFSYVGHGMYADQLKGWFRYFPPDQFLITASEEFYRDPRSVYLRALQFAGLNEWLPPEFRAYAYKIDPTARALRQADTTREALLSRFEEPNRELYALVERDFGWL